MTFQNPIPLTFSEQLNQGLWLLLTIVLAAPAFTTLAYFARFESWPDLSFLIGGLFQ